jgi:predicted adenylyl cyclase CyaB
MEEVEILVKLDETKENALAKLQKYKFIGTKKVLDVYYYDPKRKNLKQDSSGGLKECFRLRKKGDKSFVAYKIDFFEGKKWTHSDEHETEIANFEVFEKIVSHLGLKELVRVDNEKQIFETANFEIVLEDVKNLGLFLEVENMNLKGNPNSIRAKIMEFIKALGFKFEEMTQGKPELMLRKNG